jgi:small subunit ribosomal protein S9
MQDEREDAQEPEAPEGAANEAPQGAEGQEAPEQAAEAPEPAGHAADQTPDDAAEGTPEADAEEAPQAAGEQADESPEPVAEDAAEQAAAQEPVGEEADADAAEQAPDLSEEQAERRQRRKERKQEAEPKEEVIPGAHLEPDIVFEEQQQPAAGDDEYAEYAQYAEPEGEETVEGTVTEEAETEPVALTPRDLAADARYIATGKRKSAVARVILKPGEGTYSVNGRHLDEYFPRVRLQRMAHQPLEAAGYQSRMDVVARIHGGGVSAQATALRHGIARALVEADPNLRGELKRRGYLTRDPRVKERKKAGLKKARKRPQFSKR